MNDALDPLAQGEIDWLMARVGHATGSRFAAIMDRLKSGKPSAERTKYLWELVIERLTGKPTERYVTAAMQHGIEMEPLARMAYESQTGRMVTETGFVHHKTIPFVGGSVDGLIDADGIIEIKCPTSATHLQTMLSEECEHMAQIQGYLWITDREWADFISFDPRLPPKLQLYIKHIDRDPLYIAQLKDAVTQFLAEVAAQHQAILAI
jgi:putative phage-type endonuclease